VPFAAALFGLGGPLPVWTAALGAAVGWRWADSNLHAQAERRRSELRHALSVLLTLLTISLARGAGVEQALHEATDITTGWAAHRIRTVLDTAALLRQQPWRALGQFGTDTDTPAVADLAASLGLAASEGAHVQGSLAARASAMRGAATTEMETAAEQASSRMVLPLLVLGVSYLVFLLYPPLSSLSSALSP
jgi:tight adherence protein C